MFCTFTLALRPIIIIITIIELHLLWRNNPTQAWAASLLKSLDHTQTHTPSRTPPNEWSASRRGRYVHNTQQTNIHALGGIRTHDPSNQPEVDSRHRPHGHQDRFFQ